MRAKNILIYFIALIVSLWPAYSMAQHVDLIQKNKPVSIRGLCVVNDKIAWVSSSKGYVGVTTDGGKSWDWKPVKGFEKSDFRDIEAFSDHEAVIMSSGTPAAILKTTDGGSSWKVNYIENDSSYFLDAMTFNTSKHGFVMGDPVNGQFLLLETKDRGDSWRKIDGPDAAKNQAAFAASGTCANADGKLSIVTGGSIAELLVSDNTNWIHKNLPLLHGENSQGAFSVAKNKNFWVAIGGDYKMDKRRDSTACYSTDSGLNWHLAESFPSGYQSCVVLIGNNTFLSTGTSGTNLSIDRGKNWTKIDSQSFNVCGKARHGNLILLAGDNGAIGIFRK